MILLLTTSLLLLSILVIIIIIKMGFNILFSLLLIPFLLFNIGFSWYTVDELWGQAKTSTPPNHSEIIYTGVSAPWIYLIIKEKEKDPIFHKIPLTKEKEKEIAKMQKEMKNGQKIYIETDNKKIDQEALFKWYKWDHLKSMPKKSE